MLGTQRVPDPEPREIRQRTLEIQQGWTHDQQTARLGYSASTTKLDALRTCVTSPEVRRAISEDELI